RNNVKEELAEYEKAEEDAGIPLKNDTSLLDLIMCFPDSYLKVRKDKETIVKVQFAKKNWMKVNEEGAFWYRGNSMTELENQMPRGRRTKIVFEESFEEELYIDV
ncbi:MAG: hypothetical protein LBE13_21095, partial [Bacteroidales bacterium]|nr:hypothetical protein [Bacteroidales bacterium]